MKQCNDCNKVKPLSEFNWRVRAEGTKQPYCRPCQRKRNRKDYLENKSNRADKIKASRERSKKESKLYLYNYLKEKECVDCGEQRVACLQFDHIDPNEKLYNISSMIGFSTDRIEEEVSKCEVRCANCHAVRTAEQFGWYSFIE